MSSIASEINATAASGSAQWPQAAAASQASPTPPFADLLKATWTASDTAPTTQPAPAAANKPASSAAVSHHGPSSRSDFSQNTTPEPGSQAGGDAGTAPPATTGANPNPNSSAKPGANAANSLQPDAPIGNSASAADINGAAANGPAPDAAQSGAALRPLAPSSADHGDKDEDDADGSAPATDQVQPQATPLQPVAAAIAATAAAEVTPAAADASTTSGVIGEAARAHTRITALIDAGGGAQPAPNQTDGADKADGGPANQTAATANAETGTTAPARSDNAATDGADGAQSGNDDSPEQASTPSADAGAVFSEAPASGTAASGHDTTQAVALSAGSSSNSGAGNAKPTTADGLPNFGFPATGATTSPSSAAAPPPGAATSAATAATAAVGGLAVAIAARVQAGSNRFEIRLDPPELGRIDVRLDVDRNGEVTSHVTAERADTLELLQNQQPQLQHALEQAGLKTADNGLQFTLRDQSFAGQGNSGGARSSTAQLVMPNPNPDPAPVRATQIYARWGIGGGIDIRV